MTVSHLCLELDNSQIKFYTLSTTGVLCRLFLFVFTSFPPLLPLVLTNLLHHHSGTILLSPLVAAQPCVLILLTLYANWIQVQWMRSYVLMRWWVYYQQMQCKVEVGPHLEIGGGCHSWGYRVQLSQESLALGLSTGLPELHVHLSLKLFTNKAIYLNWGGKLSGPPCCCAAAAAAAESAAACYAYLPYFVSPPPRWLPSALL